MGAGMSNRRTGRHEFDSGAQRNFDRGGFNLEVSARYGAESRAMPVSSRAQSAFKAFWPRIGTDCTRIQDKDRNADDAEARGS